MANCLTIKTFLFSGLEYRLIKNVVNGCSICSKNFYYTCLFCKLHLYKTTHKTMQNQLKTIAYACLLFIIGACASKEPAPAPAKDIAGIYEVTYLKLNNVLYEYRFTKLTLEAQDDNNVVIKELTIDGTKKDVFGVFLVRKESNGDISFENNRGLYSIGILSLKYTYSSTGSTTTVELKAKKL